MTFLHRKNVDRNKFKMKNDQGLYLNNLVIFRIKNCVGTGTVVLMIIKSTNFFL